MFLLTLVKKCGINVEVSNMEMLGAKKTGRNHPHGKKPVWKNCGYEVNGFLIEAYIWWEYYVAVSREFLLRVTFDRRNLSRPSTSSPSICHIQTPASPRLH
jgi:hypothetical protein